MSTVHDTFTTFVDTLATHLDDHEARGEDIAARVYLSRFHFDRVVSAAAGESPARFSCTHPTGCTFIHLAAFGCPPESR